MIETEGKLYLIDPIYSEDLFQSYILDAAKHLFSVLYYSLNPELYHQCYNEYVTKLNINETELDILIACESIRVANRKNQLIDISNNLIVRCTDGVNTESIILFIPGSKPTALATLAAISA